MAPFEERLLEEHSQLKEKLDKLDYFLRTVDPSTINKHQLFLLGAQREAMKKYLITLELRMDNLGINYREEVSDDG